MLKAVSKSIISCFGTKKLYIMTKELSHLDVRGQAQMVDVGEKAVTRRHAVAGGRIRLSVEAFELLAGGNVSKGDVLAVARIAAIQAAKRTAEWIPLCHILPLESVRVEFFLDAQHSLVECEASVTATAKTGVEMEALTAVQAGLLTVYDMMKAVDKGMVIENVRLIKKQGGRSGDFLRNE
jgi:cyclic pyranopterin phosphate synthase